MSRLKQPILIVLGLVICLIMLRLGFWQLDRAAQKGAILKQQQTRVLQPAIDLQELIERLSDNQFAFDDLQQQRFRSAIASGQYLTDKSIYIDNQVVEGRVGYRLFTPLQIKDSEWSIMVARGWLSVGESRAELPAFSTQGGEIKLQGNLNNAPVAPPMWDSDYAIAVGAVWQYLPLQEYAQQMQLKLLPLVLELSPEQPNELETKLIRKPVRINDAAVAKHKGYAFQWFAMAMAFLIACIVLLVKTRRTVD